MDRAHLSPFGQGTYAGVPRGFILHGSRSGHPQSTAAEFAGNCTYTVNRTDGLGFLATIGDDAVALHTGLTVWAYHARGASAHYLGAEFAQPTVADPISDGQVRAFCWLVEQIRKGPYPTIPLRLVTHAEIDNTPEYGGFNDGKSDVFGKGDPRADELRGRIVARLSELGIT